MQQLDAQGPAIVQKIATEVGPLACSTEDVQKIVDSLHNGTPVTLTSSVSGETKTATFTPQGNRVGYGEAYIALALAAEQLRNAGVSNCATADQWQAVLFGGPSSTSSSMSGSTTAATSGSTSRFAGVLALRQQGQGWGQIAQASNVQLGRIVSSATSSLNSTSSASSPTGIASPNLYRSPSSSSSSQSTTSSSMQSTGQQSWPTYAPGSGAGSTSGSSTSTSSSGKSSDSSSSSESSDESPSSSGQ